MTSADCPVTSTCVPWQAYLHKESKTEFERVYIHKIEKSSQAVKQNLAIIKMNNML